MDLLKELNKLADKEYALFQAKLTPNVQKEKFIGVRVPALRTFAKEFIKTDDSKKFLSTLPHYYYDENMLHGLLISLSKNFDECISQLDEFLPFVDNWAVCDICSPKILKKDKEKLLDKIKKWISSKHTYTIRFGIEMLMSFYLDDDFKKEYLDLPLKVKSNEYYVNMMIAWFYATALAKQWASAFPIIENKLLPKWVHNKTIQKAIESYRISPSQKEILKRLKIQ